MPNDINIEVVDPGSEDDPFARPSDDNSTAASATASAGDDEGDEEDESGAIAADDDDADEDDADDDEDDAELTAEEARALQELNEYLTRQAEERVTNEIVPKLQSTYDRQIAAQQRQIDQLRQAQADREAELLAQVREAKLNGLTDAEKQQMQDQWAFDDRQAQLDARFKELTEYHNELQKAQLVADYSQFGLEIEDLDEFETPEEMELFAKEVELEYYRLMSQRGGVASTDEDDDDEDEPRTTKAKSKSQTKARVPAGANAPSDGGGGRAVPEASKFNTNTGAGAMAENIKNLGWDTVKISS